MDKLNKMKDKTRNKIYKKHNMYEILTDSSGNSPGGCGGITLSAILNLNTINIKRKDKTTILFEKEGYKMMYHLEFKDNPLIIWGHFYATEDTPQEYIDDFFNDFRQSLKNRLDELWEEGKKLVEKSREQYKSCHIITRETLDLILD